jgi:hypothetical protein
MAYPKVQPRTSSVWAESACARPGECTRLGSLGNLGDKLGHLHQDKKDVHIIEAFPFFVFEVHTDTGALFAYASLAVGFYGLRSGTNLCP